MTSKTNQLMSIYMLGHSVYSTYGCLSLTDAGTLVLSLVLSPITARVDWCMPGRCPSVVINSENNIVIYLFLLTKDPYLLQGFKTKWDT